MERIHTPSTWPHGPSRYRSICSPTRGDEPRTNSPALGLGYAGDRETEIDSTIALRPMNRSATTGVCATWSDLVRQSNVGTLLVCSDHALEQPLTVMLDRKRRGDRSPKQQR